MKGKFVTTIAMIAVLYKLMYDTLDYFSKKWKEEEEREERRLKMEEEKFKEELLREGE